MGCAYLKRIESEVMIKMLLNAKNVKQVIKDQNKQCGRDFIEALDRQVYALIIRACKANGQNKRLNAGVIE
jgi:hypothetical protein